MTTPLPIAPVIVPTPVQSNRFYCDSDGNRWDGVVSVYGSDLPVGVGTVSRVGQDGSKFTVRGGASLRTDHDFVLSDTEAPFDVESKYIIDLTPDTRAQFYNWFVNPSFENPTPTTSYLTTANRTLAGKDKATPDTTYRQKYMLVSGYTGTPVIDYSIPQASRTNLFTRPSFENGLSTGISISNGTLSVPIVTTPPGGGTKALQAAFTAPGALSAGTPSLYVPVTPGAYYQFSLYFRIAGAFTGAGTCRPDFFFRNAAQTQVGALFSGSTTVGNATWKRLTVSGQAPTGAATLCVQLACSLVGNAQFDAFLVEQVSDAAVPFGEYFDGNTLASGTTGHQWTGGDNASTSIEGGLIPVSTNAQRLLMYTKPDDALTFQRTYSYVVSGRVNVIPRIFSWADARSSPSTLNPIGTMTSPPARDWNDPMFDSGGHTWQEVLGYTAGDIAITGTLWVGLVDSTGALINGASLVQALQLSSTGVTSWYDFSVVLQVPDIALPTIYIGFFQGDGTQQGIDPVTGQIITLPDSGEFQRNWKFDGLMLDGPYTDSRPFAAPPYFDGASLLPADIKGIGYTVQALDQFTFGWDSSDATVAWTGVPEASASVLTGASKVGAYTAGCFLSSRTTSDGHDICEPVFISDPLIPSLSQWVGLLGIGALSWAPRQELINVLGRNAPVAISQARSTPNTEFRFITNTLVERGKLLSIINSGRIVLLRNPDPLYPENNWYIAIGGVSEERILPDHRDPRRRWVVGAQVVDRPSGLLAALNGQSWQSVKDTYENWQAVDVGNDAWLNVLIGPATVPTAPGQQMAFMNMIAENTVPNGSTWSPVA